jgi:penicillin-insensitive murein endopeptidase
VPDVHWAVRACFDHPVHATARILLRAAGSVLALVLLPGCLGIFAGDGSSVSVGSHSKGALLHGVAIPFSGAGYEVHRDWRARDHRYSTAAIVRWLTGVFRDVNQAIPGSTAYLGDMSGRRGGDAAMHRSHASGRDIDIFYFASDGNGQSLHDLPAMLHFGDDGRAIRWSAGKVGRPVKDPLPDARFDARRNWALVRAMLGDSAVEVQWIFVHRDLAGLLLAEAEREGAPEPMVSRARAILHQPTDSQPHDDHMHVRVFCDPADRSLGCSDKGPARWLKKHWKYMRASDSVTVPRHDG